MEVWRERQLGMPFVFIVAYLKLTKTCLGVIRPLRSGAKKNRSDGAGIGSASELKNQNWRGYADGRRPLAVCNFLLGAELLTAENRATVAGMDITKKIKPRDLVDGGRYLNRNGLFIRQIEEIEGKTVHYHYQYGSWSCLNSSFVQACPTVATPEDEARVAEAMRKLPRGG